MSEERIFFKRKSSRKENLFKEKRGKAVMLVETGEIFKSLAEASIKCVGDKSLAPAICRACSGKVKTAGKYRWTYNLELTDEEKQKILGAKKIFDARKKILCLETGRVFDGVREVLEFANMSDKSDGYFFKSLLDVPAKKIGQYHWTYDIGLTEKQRAALLKLTLGVQKQNCKKILCVETGEIFNSLSEAARAKGISGGNLNTACKIGGRTAGGFHWTYDIGATQKRRQEIIRTPRKSQKKVLCVETGEIFDSITEAAIAKKTFPNSISVVCSIETRTAGGFHWKFV